MRRIPAWSGAVTKVPSYSGTMVLRLVTLALAQGLDLVSFQVMVRLHGPGAEANPLVADLFEVNGLGALVVLKIALVVLVAALAVAGMSQGGRWTRGLIGGVPLAIAIAIGLIGGITNASTILA